ncbi:MAG TPA: cytochrome c3 family protein [Anaerolineaceae bacterium]|nr:cytochrome c3 family protein [Anaerolineaceae bacterium]
MDGIKKFITTAGFRIFILLLLLVILSAAVNLVLLSQSTPAQPIEFPHVIHVGLGAQCTYCHPGVAWGPNAGLPSLGKCWGCHQHILKESPKLDILKSYVAEDKAIPWVPVAIQPDFVHFTHRAHVVTAGITCESCHGDVSKMLVAEKQSGQNMGWCLDCHKRMRPDDFTRLSDCSTCHY